MSESWDSFLVSPDGGVHVGYYYFKLFHALFTVETLSTSQIPRDYLCWHELLCEHQDGLQTTFMCAQIVVAFITLGTRRLPQLSGLLCERPDSLRAAFAPACWVVMSTAIDA